MVSSLTCVLGRHGDPVIAVANIESVSVNCDVVFKQLQWRNVKWTPLYL